MVYLPVLTSHDRRSQTMRAVTEDRFYSKSFSCTTSLFSWSLTAPFHIVPSHDRYVYKIYILVHLITHMPYFYIQIILVWTNFECKWVIYLQIINTHNLTLCLSSSNNTSHHKTNFTFMPKLHDLIIIMNSSLVNTISRSSDIGKAILNTPLNTKYISQGYKRPQRVTMRQSLIL